MSIQTNFRAQDMLGTPEAAAAAAKKAAPVKAAPKAAKYTAPKVETVAEPVAVVEALVEDAPVVDEAVEAPTAE